jgi:hypothetical protein
MCPLTARLPVDDPRGYAVDTLIVQFVAPNLETAVPESLQPTEDIVRATTPSIPVLTSEPSESLQHTHVQTSSFPPTWFGEQSPQSSTSACQQSLRYPGGQHASPHSQFSEKAHTSIVLSPESSISRIYSHSPALVSSPLSAFGPSWPFSNLHEARLMHHYIVHLSGQVCGPARKEWSSLIPLPV